MLRRAEILISTAPSAKTRTPQRSEPRASNGGRRWCAAPPVTAITASPAGGEDRARPLPAAKLKAKVTIGQARQKRPTHPRARPARSTAARARALLRGAPKQVSPPPIPARTRGNETSLQRCSRDDACAPRGQNRAALLEQERDVRGERRAQRQGQPSGHGMPVSTNGRRGDSPAAAGRSERCYRACTRLDVRPTSQCQRS